jgi:hypothetical protein
MSGQTGTAATISLAPLLAAIRRLLADGAAAGTVASSAAAEFVSALTAIPESAPSVDGYLLPVCRYWGEALRAAAPTFLAEALIPIAPHLRWTQNPNYRRQPPSPRFLDDYGYAVVAGPVGGAQGLAVAPALALGVMLLGPRTVYPAHAHPAVEIYLPLGPARWQCDGGPWRHRDGGSPIHHASGVVHATATDEAPLLALYLWRGDLGTHARLTG